MTDIPHRDTLALSVLSTAVCGSDGVVQECVTAQEIDRDNWHRD
jgi:hypothetical protein